MTCPSCGQGNAPEARFCDACGTRLSQSCAVCGAELRPGVRFCVSCGSLIEEGMPAVARTVAVELPVPPAPPLPSEAPPPPPGAPPRTVPFTIAAAFSPAAEDQATAHPHADPATSATVPFTREEPAPIPAPPSQREQAALPVSATVAMPAPPRAAQLRRPVPFAGRADELARLGAALDRAAAGQGSVLVVSGAAGIGKTRMLEEFRAEMQQRGGPVLSARGEQASPAHHLWEQVIEDLIATCGVDALTAAGPDLPDLVRALPSLRVRLPGITPSATPAEQAYAQAERAITALLRDAARDRPVALLFDDLDLADASSIALLAAMVDVVTSARLLIVAACDVSDLSYRHPLASMLSKLGRAGAGEHLRLSSLGTAEVEHIIAAVAGTPLPEALVAEITELAEGCPLVVIETVRLLAAESRLEHSAQVESWIGAVPCGRRELAGRRAAALSPECGALLAAAAVAGRAFDADLVAGVTGVSPERAAQLLVEAHAAGIVSDAPGGGYRWTHRLVRAAVLADLSGVARARLHGRVLAVLEGRAGPNPDPAAVTAMAKHAVAAAPPGDGERAIAYARRAAGVAADALAPETAVMWLERALDLLNPEDAAGDAARAEILLSLGESRRRAGAPDAALQALRQAAGLARRQAADTGTRTAAALLARAALAYRDAQGERAWGDSLLMDLLREAAVGLTEADGELRARVLTALSQVVAGPPRGSAARDDGGTAPEGTDRPRRGAETIKWRRPS